MNKRVKVLGVMVAVLEDLEVGVLRMNDDTDTFGSFYGSDYHRALAIRPDSGDLMIVARARWTPRWFLDGNDPSYDEHYDALQRLRAAR